jgi:tRNA pseudouridine32 synthase/23S rRNA pseudouridine746 synthase
MSYITIFENEFFIIVDKNALILSVPGRDGEKDDRPILGRILEKDLGITIYPVHRLDYEVQGLIMFAKTPLAHKAANAWFEKKEVHKTYIALSKALPGALGNFTTGVSLVWKCKLLRGKKRAYESPHGKDSTTKALLVSIDETNTFHWELNPITGRSHQLRFELFRHGHPILGDSLYSSDQSFNNGVGIALRSFRIDFSNSPGKEKFLLPDFVEIKKFN